MLPALEMQTVPTSGSPKYNSMCFRAALPRKGSTLKLNSMNILTLTSTHLSFPTHPIIKLTCIQESWSQPMDRRKATDWKQTVNQIVARSVNLPGKLYSFKALVKSKEQTFIDEISVDKWVVEKGDQGGAYEGYQVRGRCRELQQIWKSWKDHLRKQPLGDTGSLLCIW